MRFIFSTIGDRVSVHIEQPNGSRRYAGSLVMEPHERAAFETLIALAGRPLDCEAQR